MRILKKIWWGLVSIVIIIQVILGIRYHEEIFMVWRIANTLAESPRLARLFDKELKEHKAPGFEELTGMKVLSKESRDVKPTKPILPEPELVEEKRSTPSPEEVLKNKGEVIIFRAERGYIKYVGTVPKDRLLPYNCSHIKVYCIEKKGIPEEMKCELMIHSPKSDKVTILTAEGTLVLKKTN